MKKIRKAFGIALSAALMVTMMPATLAMNYAEAAAATYGESLSVECNLEEDAFAFKRGQSLDNIRKEEKKLPDSFDLRNVDTDGDGEGDKSFITQVKVQNPFGTCWGFAAASAAESSLISAGLADLSVDLSEKQIAYFAYKYIDDPDDPQYMEGIHFENVSKKDRETSAFLYDNGGFTRLVTSLFASGIGPSLEHADDPGSLLAYRGARGERTFWSVATKYNDDGTPDPDSYQRKAVWYSRDDDWSLPNEYRYVQDYRMVESVILPTPAGYTNKGYEFQKEAVTAIKKQMYDNNRAVCVSFCAESYLPGQDTTDQKYMSKNWAHFTNTKEHSNHTVTIVGWDDNYPKENFDSTTEKGGSSQPEGNGAFLIKNSWGSELNSFPNNGYRHWGLLEGLDGVPYDKDAKAKSDRATGYFWISYYDRSMFDPEAFVFEKAPEDSQLYIEQFDKMNVLDVCEVYGNGLSIANVFETEATSELKEISAMTSTPGTELTYDVYLLGDSFSRPDDGILIAHGTKTFDYGGYHRIALDTPKVLSKSQRFSVVINEKFKEPYYGIDDYACIAYEYNSPGARYYTIGVINERESFLYNGDLDEWIDLNDKDLQNFIKNGDDNIELDNFPVKAYLEPIADPGGEGNFKGYLIVNNWAEKDPGTFKLKVGESKTLDAEFCGISKDMPESWNPGVTWQSQDENVMTVTPKTPNLSSAVITGVAAGKTNLLVDTGEFGVRMVSIIVEKPAITGVELGAFDPAYTGREIRPQVINVKSEDGRTDLKEGTDYTVAYSDNVNVGTGTAVVTGTGEYGGSVSLEFAITEARNPLTVKGKTASVNYSKLSKKSQTLAVSKVISFVDKGQGKLSYQKISGNKKITVNAKTGKVTVKKGLKKNKYKVKIKVTAAGNNNYKAASRTVTATIRVK